MFYFNQQLKFDFQSTNDVQEMNYYFNYIDAAAPREQKQR